MPSLIEPVIPVGAFAASEQPVLAVSDGVVLRPWRPDDAAAVLEAYQDPAIQQWHGLRADSLEEARGFIQGWRNGWGAETGGQWAVAAGPAADAVLGRVAVKSLVLVQGLGEIAYWTMPAARGAGVCPRAVDTVARWALGDGGFQRLELQHSTANQASCRVAVKSGFAPEGVRREAVLHVDGWHDMHLHARVRGD